MTADLTPDPDAPGAPLPTAEASEGQRQIPASQHDDEGGSDSGDEAAPDYRLIASLASKMNTTASSQNNQSSLEASQIVIPKRGEKDFEPTGFVAQNKALESSRKAMFDVISAERRTANKGMSTATWEPLLNRAIVHSARGSVMSAMGVSKKIVVLQDGRDEDLADMTGKIQGTGSVPRAGIEKQGIFYPKTRSRLELFPEEALHLIERGALECMVRTDGRTADFFSEDIHTETKSEQQRKPQQDVAWIPMSVQQAFSVMMEKDGCTRERYQLYVYLKRLGYFVQRASLTDALRSSATSLRHKATRDVSADGVLADPKHPLHFVTIFDLLVYPFRRILQASSHGIQNIVRWFISLLRWFRERIQGVTKRSASTSAAQGRGLLGVAGGRWDSYDAVFDRLRIVPSGHDVSLGSNRANNGDQRSNVADEAPEIFFYAWRPATRFKRTDPPLPEYRIAVVDAQKTSLPSAHGFKALYDQLPPITTHRREGSAKEDADSSTEINDEEERRAEEERRRNDESYGKGAKKKRHAEEKAKAIANREKSTGGSAGGKQLGRVWPFPRLLGLMRLFLGVYSLLPPGCAAGESFYPPSSRKKPSGKRSVNVFVPLKSGRRNVVLAVNDSGTTSLLRFGESEFHRWRLAGSGRV